MGLVQQIGQNVDRLIACDLLSYGAIDRLFASAVAAQGGPLSLKAADLLLHALSGGGGALLLTGLILPGQHPHGETDGPLGTGATSWASARLRPKSRPTGSEHRSMPRWPRSWPRSTARAPRAIPRRIPRP